MSGITFQYFKNDTVKNFDALNVECSVYEPIFNILNTKHKEFIVPCNVIFISYVNKKFLDAFKSSIKEKLKKFEILPTLFIGVENYLFPTDTDGELESLRSIFWNLTGLPRYFNFFDSSIWTTYISILDKDWLTKSDEFFDRVEKKNELYKLNITNEFFEFYLRIATNSFVENIGGHGSHVSPFVFHSETRMKSLYESKNYDSKSLSYTIKESRLKWKVLLIDDYAQVPLAPLEDTNYNRKWSKAGIIASLLNDIGLTVNIIPDPAEQVDFNEVRWQKNPNPTLEIFCMGKNMSLSGASNWISERSRENKNTFELIFIDYLLWKKADGTREYGYELFNYLKKVELKKLKAPLNRYWIFNISSFDTAMSDRLREQGLSNQSSEWYYDRGGDPVNTPELFLYNLLRFMNLQMQMLNAMGQESDYTENDLLQKILNKIFCGTPTSIKTKAIKEYAQLIKLKSYLDELLKEAHSSELVKIFLVNKNMQVKLPYIPVINQNEIEDGYSQFWEHLLHFVQSVAYGSGLDTGALFEEYLFIDEQLKHVDRYTDILQHMRNYIINLNKKFN